MLSSISIKSWTRTNRNLMKIYLSHCKRIDKIRKEDLRIITGKQIFRNIRDATFGETDTMENSFCFIVYYFKHYPEQL
ncbi:cytochrome P450 [Rhizophagus clarus]|uniref:Cytochrome P450 n=1 Tax=Rhizophagus clarus TaxID=94130 RepID=A0A8H3MC98_9GLOM|nr:cytochrome P450 [Rhizophagus clarus]